MTLDYSIQPADWDKSVQVIMPGTSFVREIIIDNKTQVCGKARKDYLSLIILIHSSKLGKKRYAAAIC